MGSEVRVQRDWGGLARRVVAMAGQLPRAPCCTRTQHRPRCTGRDSGNHPSSWGRTRPRSSRPIPWASTVVWVTAERQMVTYDVGERREIDSRKLQDSTELARPPVLYVDDEQVVYR